MKFIDLCLEKDFGLMSEFLVTDWLLKRKEGGKAFESDSSEGVIKFRDQIKSIAFAYFADVDEIRDYRY